MTRASDTARLLGAGATINDGTTITTDDNDPQLTLISTDADANEGPVIDLQRNSASPADDDNGPRIKFTGKNDAGEDVEYTRVRFNIQDMTDGTEDGQMDIATMINGSLQNRVFINDTGVVINDGSIDSDFRVESDNETHALFVEGSTGNVFVNNTGASPLNGQFTVYNDSSQDAIKTHQATSGTTALWNRIDHTASYFAIFRYQTSTVGSITTDGSNTTYGTSSDYRLKENLEYSFDATTRLKQLKPCRFNWIADENNKTVDGFIAHEVSDIVPEAVVGEKDAVDDEGNIKPQGIDQSKLVPLLVKTIQELEARITTLENA